MLDMLINKLLEIDAFFNISLQKPQHRWIGNRHNAEHNARFCASQNNLALPNPLVLVSISTSYT